MRKNLTIVASILLVVGGIALGWVLTQMDEDRNEAAKYKSEYGDDTEDCARQYNEWFQTPPQERAELPLLLDKNGKTKSREQLWQEQQGRLKADLDKLAVNEMIAPSLAEVLYGEGWQAELTQYKKRKQLQSFVLTGSIVCTSLGGVVYSWWLLVGSMRLLAKGASGLRQLPGRLRRKAPADDDEEEEEPAPGDAEDTQPQPKAEEDQDESPKRPRITVKPSISDNGQRERRPMGSLTQRPQTIPLREKAAGSFSGEKLGDMTTFLCGTDTQQVVQEKSKPLDNTLNDLTEQVSAIREYAAHQQDRLEKLQDGYDWNIIRTFCLRVIRAVDNLDSRISQLDDEGGDTTHLEEVKDELVFALESSGIEQFEPEINSEYRGQEKYAEAVKDKASCDDPEQAGKIADIIRPGYQYFINEENVKIVRPAQVRLYA